VQLGIIESVSIARKSREGAVSLIEVLQVDEKLLRASDARAQAQTETARAAVTAFWALGGGWQSHETATPL